MNIFFLDNKLFCLSLDLLDILATWQTHDVFVKLPEYLRDRTTFIFWHPMLLIEFNSISNMGCH